MWTPSLIFGCFLLFGFSGAFQIWPQQEEVIVNQDNTVSFYYGLRPWPPPCCKINNTDWDNYLDVTLNFFNSTDTGDVKLCDTKFEKGNWVNTTGLCSRFNARMLDFSPENNDYVAFSFINTTLWDQGSYKLQVAYGTDEEELQETAVSRLVVHAPPEQPDMNVQPSGEVKVGDTVTMSCSVSGANPPAEIKWTRDYVGFIPDPTDYIKAEDWMGTTSWSFTHKVVRLDHGITFACDAFNSVGTSSKGVTLVVRYEPYLTLSPCVQQDMKYHVIEEGHADFTCAVNSWPEYDNSTLLWKKDDIVIEEAKNYTKYSVNDLSRGMNAVYQCEASNAIGKGIARCELDIQYGADITLQDKWEIVIHSHLDITCVYDSNPEPYEVYWSKEEDLLFRQDGPVLSFVSLEAKDAGSYVCHVLTMFTPTDGGSRVSESTKTTKLHVKYEATWSPYALEKFSGRVSQSATVVCDTMAYPSPNFTWRRLGNNIQEGPRISIRTEGSVSSLSISGLADGDFGDYECIVQNDMGGRTYSLLLLEPGKPDPPQVCHTVESSGRKAMIRCLPGYAGGEILSYHVVDAHTGRKIATEELVSQGESRMHPEFITLEFTDLAPSTNYSLKIFAENRHGRSLYYLETRVETLYAPPIPTSPPPDVGAIVGGIIGGLVGLALVIAIVMYIRKNGWPEFLQNKELEEASKMKAQMRHGSDDVGRRYGDSVKRYSQEVGKLNNAYSTDDDEEIDRAVQNEYVPHPGVAKIDVVPGSANNRQSYSDIRRNPETDNYRNSRAQVRFSANIDVHPSDTRGQHQPVMMRDKSDARHSTLRPASAQRYNFPSPRESGNYSTEDIWEMHRDAFDFIQKIGEGCFSEVWTAHVENLQGRGGRSLVAVKMLKEDCPPEETGSLYRELQLMKALRPHPNVVSLIGCCTREDPMLIVMEYASRDNLQLFLRENRQTRPSSQNYHQRQQQVYLTNRHLVVFALQVANGMAYVSSNEMLHRDLAARNVLLDNKLTCKISDFGFARDVAHSRQYESRTRRRLPLRWMAPESLFDNIYTTKSDVWAYGVLLWEIVTLGSSPYPGMSGSDVMELLQMGYRMEKPKHCSRNMYDLMTECWQDDPGERPSFQDLQSRLEGILDILDRDPSQVVPVNHMTENMFAILRDMPNEMC